MEYRRTNGSGTTREVSVNCAEPIVNVSLRDLVQFDYLRYIASFNGESTWDLLHQRLS